MKPRFLLCLWLVVFSCFGDPPRFIPWLYTTEAATTVPNLVAASDAPALIKALAKYKCNGTDDHTTIQTAINAVTLAYPLGGELFLSAGTFYCGGVITVPGALKISGAGTKATTIHMSPDLNLNGYDGHLFNCSPDAAQGFFTLEDVFISGGRLSSSDAQLGALERITGISRGVNTAANGRLYLSMVSDGGSNWHLDFYSDSGRTAKVAHTGSFAAASVPCPQALTADNASGIGGYIGILSGPSASTSIILKGNTAGSAVVGSANAWDMHLRHLMIMNSASDAVTTAQGWGFEMEDCVIEYCGGNGVSVTAGSGDTIIAHSKIIDNAGHGIYLAVGGGIITDCLLNGANSVDLGTGSNAVAGLYVTAADNVVGNCFFTAIQSTNYGLWSTGSRIRVSGCKATAKATSSNNYGFYNQGGFNGFSGCSAYGFSGASAFGFYNRVTGAVFSGCIADACATGYGISGYNRVQLVGCYANACATGVNMGTSTSSVISGSVFDTCTSYNLYLAGGTQNTIVGNQFYAGPYGIYVDTGNAVVDGNVFKSQTTLPIREPSGTGLLTSINNIGGPNYDAGARTVISTATYSVTTNEIGSFFWVSADSTITLPTVAPGLVYWFVMGGKDAAVQITLSPQASDAISTPGNAGTVNKSIINTKATAVGGDFVKVVGASTGEWKVDKWRGIWAINQ